MTVTILRETEVERPTPDPLTSSVLDHATVQTFGENEGFGWRNNEGLWPSYNCIDTLTPTAECVDPLEEREPKNFQFAEWVPAFQFTVYGGVQCKALGLDEADMQSEVDRVFEANEGKGIEQALLLNRFVATDSDAEVSWDEPVDVTPGATVSLTIALAELEGYAAAVYAGIPTIHMPRSAATVLEASGLIVWTDGKAFTKNGSKVAMGGGYDSTEPSGTKTLYATGEVYVERSSGIHVRAWVLPGDGSGDDSDGNGVADNSVIALAERMYRVAIDCFVAKSTATVWS